MIKLKPEKKFGLICFTLGLILLGIEIAIYYSSNGIYKGNQFTTMLGGALIATGTFAIFAY